MEMDSIYLRGGIDGVNVRFKILTIILIIILFKL